MEAGTSGPGDERLALRTIARVVILAGALAASLPASAAGREGSLAGQLLVATPGMKDPRFSRTVIYLVQHDAHGAMGLIVNRPFKEVPVALALRRIGASPEGAEGSVLLHYGGPVEPGSVFVLHTTDYAGSGTQVVADGVGLSRDAAVLRAIGTGKGPRRSLFLLSYSGWAPGQLERELRAGGWITVRADPGIVFDGDHETKWDRAMARRGIEL